MAGKTQWTFSLERSIPSDTSVACELIRDFVRQMEQAGHAENLIFAVHMALEEAIVNAIKHGNIYDNNKNVFVRAAFSEDRFEATVIDEGDGFDPSQIPDPCAEENIELTSGRGLKLIANFMDEVRFGMGGRQVVMRKSFAMG
jgi:serine/threonine-protein kinase RsbW